MSGNALLEPLTTELSWDDLVLDDPARKQVGEIVAWARRDPSPGRGYRSLFVGPQGPCKSLVTALIGKESKRPVYRVGLRAVVSKKAGETQTDLESLFDALAIWILFFDEADSLFGKRTGEDANDRHANQQIAYLLQRIEDYPGIAILATNRASQIDEAFARRFQSTIAFPTACTASR